MEELWHMARTEPEAIRSKAQKAYLQYKKHAWKRAMAAALVVSGGALSFLLRLEEALRDLMEAVALATETQAYSQLAHARLRLGGIYAQLGEYSAAFEELEACFEAANKDGSELYVAAALNNVGEIYRESGRYLDAIANYDRALAIARSAGHPGSLGIYIGNRGMSRHAMGEFDAAVKDYEEASAIHKNYGNYTGLLELECRRAELAEAQGDQFAVQAIFTEALALAVDKGLSANECDLLVGFGSYLVRQGRLPEAEIRLRRAMDIGRDRRSWRHLSQALRALSDLASAKADYKSALARSRLAERLERRSFDARLEQRMSAMKIRNDLSWAEREASHARNETVRHKRRAQEMERSYELLRLVTRLGRAVTAELELQAACTELYDGVRSFVDAPGFFLALWDGELKALRYALNKGLSASSVSENLSAKPDSSAKPDLSAKPDSSAKPDLSAKPDSSAMPTSPATLPSTLDEPSELCLRCFKEGRELVLQGRRASGQGGEARSEVFLPVMFASDTLGVMAVQSPREDAYDEASLAALRVLCSFIAVAIKNAQRMEEANTAKEAEIYRLKNVELKAKGAELEKALAEVRSYAKREKEYKDMILAWNKRLEEQVLRRTRELEKLAISDGLTGLYNRRHSFALLEREMKTAQRYGRDLSVIMIDVDDFKRINDERGHRSGDAVLAEIARTIRLHLRASDIAGRYGGEEFLVVLPETPLDGALILAERIRIAVTATSAFEAMGIAMTLSCGIAAYKGTMDTMELLELADTRLYKAKETGKNRVVAD
jgi:diguanylate cyclase (GGDEF)-like protein